MNDLWFRLLGCNIVVVGTAGKTPNVSRRYVPAEWQLADGPALQGGLIRVHA